jgi:hypothetical protein
MRNEVARICTVCDCRGIRTPELTNSFLERFELSVAVERLERFEPPLLAGSDRNWQLELCCEGEEQTGF